MKKVKTASGREFNCDMFSVIYTPPRCYISLPGETLADVVSVFSNPNETDQILYGEECIYGFSVFQAVSVDNDVVMVTLRGD